LLKLCRHQISAIFKGGFYVDSLHSLEQLSKLEGFAAVASSVVNVLTKQKRMPSPEDEMGDVILC
jgi:hypothetical protein